MRGKLSADRKNVFEVGHGQGCTILAALTRAFGWITAPPAETNEVVGGGRSRRRCRKQTARAAAVTRNPTVPAATAAAAAAPDAGGLGLGLGLPRSEGTWVPPLLALELVSEAVLALVVGTGAGESPAERPALPAF